MVELISVATVTTSILLLIIALLSVRFIYNFKIKILIIILFIIILPINYKSFLDIVGHPKPYQLVSSSTFNKPIQILGYYLSEGKGIYLYVILPKTSTPMSYKLKWNIKTAQNLMDGIKSAKKNKSKLYLVINKKNNNKTKNKNGYKGVFKFYAKPQPALPKKNYQKNKPIEYSPPK